jgi:predicted XRE-type DNA-binding protein
MPHYTSLNSSAYIDRITFDFVAQLEERLATVGMSQCELAKTLEVSESAVSQVLNRSRTNFSLKTMVQYAHALGMKVAIVAYDDGDPSNNNGPVGSDIFSRSWNALGKPRDSWAIADHIKTGATNHAGPAWFIPTWSNGYVNSTQEFNVDRPNTAQRLTATIAPVKGIAYARS